MSIRPTGYYENENHKNIVQFWHDSEWDPKFYTKDAVKELFQSNGWEVPVFMTTEQAFELPSSRLDNPAGGEGWYTEPNDPLKVRYWDGQWAQMSFFKNQIIANHQDNSLGEPVFDPHPVSAEPAKWAVGNTEYDLWQYGCPGSWSEYFDGEAIAQEFLIPRFYQNGGTPGLFEADTFVTTKADDDLLKLIISRITLAEVRNKLGDTAREFNSGPRWIRAKDNERLARWWDGSQFTGEVELIGVLQQREHDAEAEGDLVSVSQVPATLETEAGVWYGDPEDSTSMIRWGGTRWDRRKSVQQLTVDLFEKLNEPVPVEWNQPAYLTPRHAELIRQLNDRINGQEGWYKEPGRFDDLFMRYWDSQTWTEHTSAQVAGWFDDPWNTELLRYWLGTHWSDKTRNKEAEQRRAERSSANAEMAKNIGIYLGLKATESIVWQFSKERKNQRILADRADESRTLRDNAAREQAKFYRDRQKFTGLL